MGKALISSAYAVGGGAANGVFYGVANGTLNQTSTEANVGTYIGVAGTVGGYSSVRVNNVGSSRSLVSRVNGANGNISISPTDTTAGTYTDASNSDSVAQADIANWSWATSATSAIYHILSHFEASANHAVIYGGGNDNALGTASTTYYHPINGRWINNTTEANAQVRARVAATYQRLSLYVQSNTRTDTSTLTFRNGGAGGSQTISIGSSVTGRLTDTTNTDSVASGDLINLSVAYGAGAGQLRIYQCNVTAVNSSSSSNDVSFCYPSGSGDTWTSATRYGSLFSAGSAFTGTTESDFQVAHGFDVTVSKFRFYIRFNNATNTITAAFRVGGADGNQTISIGSGVTGHVEDTTNSDSVAAADLVSWAFTNNNGSFAIESSAVTEEPTSSGITLAAGSGSFTFTGTAASLELGREVAAGSGTFSFTGTAAALEIGRLVSALSGTFSFAGANASLFKGLTLSGDTGSYTFSGTEASLEQLRLLAANSGSFVFAGTNASLFKGIPLSAGSGSFAFTGSDVSFLRTWLLSGGSGSFVFTGSDATLTTLASLIADGGSFVFTGTDVTFITHRVLSAENGSFLFSGFPANLVYGEGVVEANKLWRLRGGLGMGF